MSKKSVKLDVDPNIMERNLLLPGNSETPYENMLQSLYPSTSKEDAPWKIVKPKPGFCVKTTNSNKEKVFVNICQMDEIPEPQDISDRELLDMLDSEEQCNYRVPLSLQEPRIELDKSGQPATVYDVAINSSFCGKVQHNVVKSRFLMAIVFDGLEDKYDIELNKTEYTILKNRKSLGDLSSHRIRNQKGPYQPPKRLIEEISSSKTISHKGDISDTSVKSVPFRLYSKKPDVVYGEFFLEKVSNIKDVTVDVGEDRIVIETTKQGTVIDIFLPCSIQQEKSTAEFNQDTKVLLLVMPLFHSDSTN